MFPRTAGLARQLPAGAPSSLPEEVPRGVVGGWGVTSWGCAVIPRSEHSPSAAGGLAPGARELWGAIGTLRGERPGAKSFKLATL